MAGGQRDIAGDDQIAGVQALDDLVVGHVETRGYLQRFKAWF